MTPIVEKWISERIPESELNRYGLAEEGFIPHARIEERLAKGLDPDKQFVREIIAKSMEIRSLSPEETAALIQVEDPALIAEMEDAADRIKRKVYDNRIVTFAPMYFGNVCVNDCLYCGFRRSNGEMKRRVLTLDEIREETAVLAGKIGHRRAMLDYGEHPATDIDYIIQSMRAVYDVKIPLKRGTANIRRVNINAAPMQIDELRRLNEAGLGTYQVFQETYHRPTYRLMHPEGTLKGDYRWRLYVMHRAMEAGIDDVGVGVLFGLYDWKYEMMALVHHGLELEGRYGVGPHTVSVPRIKAANNSPMTEREKYHLSDDAFRKVLTIIRLALPYTGLILTARETADFRKSALRLGITQMDASTRIGVGAYADGSAGQTDDRQQFLLGDTRSLEDLIRDLAKEGYITSFCTAGYRCGRTGKCIMDLLRTGAEGKFCKLNAVLTFREWIDDFASAETRTAADAVLDKELNQIRLQQPRIYDRFAETYRKVCGGERDVYF